MGTVQSLTLIDSNLRRRAAICHSLSGNGTHVEPFEDIPELVERWPHNGTILAHDDGRTIPGLLHHMIETGNWLPVIAYDEAPSPQQVVSSIFNGAVDYIAWPFRQTELAGILEAAQQQTSSMRNIRLREAMARSRIDCLTRREQEVLGCVANGLSNRMIGEKLEISPRTVEIHRANLLNKMGAKHSSEAIRVAIEASLV